MKSPLLALPILLLGSLAIAPGCVVVASDEAPEVLACVADDSPCSHDEECCSNLCASDGACGLPVNSCLEDNAACSSDGECCSGVCADDGACGYPGGVTVVTCA